MRHPLRIATALVLLLAAGRAEAMVRNVGGGGHWVEYHDATAAEHHAQVALLRWDHRVISLNLSSSAAAPRFAAVWVHDGLGGQIITPDGCCDLIELDDFLGDHEPIIVTAVGDHPFTATYAAVIESFHTDMVFSVALTDNSLTGDDLASANEQRAADGYVLRWISGYGTSTNPYYTAVWERLRIPGTPSSVADAMPMWTGRVGQTAAEWQVSRDAHATQWVRPAVIAPAPDGTFATAWYDSLHGEVISYVGLTRTELAAKIAEHGHALPVMVQATGAYRSPRFAVIFASPGPLIANWFRWWVGATREWRAEGPGDGPPEGAQSLASLEFAGFDDEVKSYMQRKNIRGASAAITYQGRLVHARGYTWAELDAGYPVTTPDRHFRIGSMTKFFTAFTAFLLDQNASSFSIDQLLMDTVEYWPGISVHPDLEPITIRDLLGHRSGFRKPYAADDVVANWLGSPIWPVNNQLQLNFELDHAGDPWYGLGPLGVVDYSNTGYFLIGEALASQRGTTFLEVLDDILYVALYHAEPARPRYAGTEFDEQIFEGAPGDDARAHPYPGLELASSVMRPPGTLVPKQYGRTNLVLASASGGLSATAAQVAKLLAAFALPATKLGPLSDATISAMRMPVGGEESDTVASGLTTQDCAGMSPGELIYAKGGAVEGGDAMGMVRWSDKVTVVLLTNRMMKGTPSASACDLHDWVSDVHWANLGGLDLFPAQGIPSFPNQ